MNAQGQNGYGAELPAEWRETLSTEQKQQLEQLRLETERAAEYAAQRSREDTERLLKGGEDVAASELPLPMQAIDAHEQRGQASRGLPGLPGSGGGDHR